MNVNISISTDLNQNKFQARLNCQIKLNYASKFAVYRGIRIGGYFNYSTDHCSGCSFLIFCMSFKQH